MWGDFPVADIKGSLGVYLKATGLMMEEGISYASPGILARRKFLGFDEYGNLFFVSR